MFTEIPDAPEAILDDDLVVSSDLMAKITDIVGRRDQIQDLIRKAEGSKDKVKPEIYQKVTADYEEKMKAVAGEYEPVAKDIRTVLADIRLRERELRIGIEKNGDTLEELRFRCEVGEFSKEDLDNREGDNVKVLKELEKKITIMETTYEACKKVLGEEDFEEAVRDEAPSAEVISTEDEFIVTGGGEEVISIDGGTPEPHGGDIDIPGAMPDDPVPAQAGGDFDITLSDVDPSALAEVEVPPPPVVDIIPDTLATPELAPLPVEAPPPPTDGDFEATISFAQRCFIKLLKEDGGEETFLLGNDSLSIGRNHKNDVVLLDRGISRKHAQIMRESSGKYSIMDLSSGGGLMVNGDQVKKAELHNGDKIGIGDFALSFVEEMA